jgi:hypothetical protein
LIRKCILRPVEIVIWSVNNCQILVRSNINETAINCRDGKNRCAQILKTPRLDLKVESSLNLRQLGDAFCDRQANLTTLNYRFSIYYNDTSVYPQVVTFDDQIILKDCFPGKI